MNIFDRIKKIMKQDNRNYPKFIKFKKDRYDTYARVIDSSWGNITVKSLQKVNTYYGMKDEWEIEWPNPYATEVTEEEYEAAKIMGE